MNIMEAIYTRRSVREFTDAAVSTDDVAEIIRAGSWAPSGLNNQPWRFVIIRSTEVRKEMAKLTKYRRIVEDAPVCIAVFLDNGAIYNSMKDHQGVGACLQNMLLATHALGLGAVWLGEIVNKADEVRELLKLPEALKLQAVVALGHPKQKERSSSRKSLEELVVREIV